MIELTLDGKKVAVDPTVLREAGFLPKDEVEAGYVPLAKHNSEMASQRAKARGLRNPEELLEDDDFLAQLIDKRGDVLRERLGVKGKVSEETLNKHLRDVETRFREKELAPLQQEYQALTRRLAQATVMEARQGEGYELVEDMIEPLQAYYGPRLKLDKASGQFFLTDEKGEFDVTPFPGKDRPPYRTVQDDLRERAATGKNLGWFKSKARSGADFNNNGGAGGGGDLNAQIHAAEAKGDFATAGRLKAQQLLGQMPGVR